MGKNSIRILIGVLLVALLALLAIQYSWVKNATELNEKEFDRQVNSALEGVSEQLQSLELAGSLRNNLHNVFYHKSSIFPKDSLQKNVEIREEHFPGGIKVIQERISSSRDSVGSSIKEKKLELRIITSDSGPHRSMPHRKMVMEVERHLSVDSGKPKIQLREEDEEEMSVEAESFALNELDSLKTLIWKGERGKAMEEIIVQVLRGEVKIEDRVSAKQLDSLLRGALRDREIQEPFHYWVANEKTQDRHFVHFEGSQPSTQPETAYKVRLFPKDLSPSGEYLYLDFPQRKSGSLSAVGLMLSTSGVLVLVILLCFGLALYALFRQQKMAQLQVDFVNNMTHELKTPIATISLASEALNDPDMASNPDQVQHFSGIIQAENQRLQSQVERVLQVAHLERGSLGLRKQTLDLGALASQEAERIRQRIESRGGKLSYSGPAEPAMILGDKIHLSGMIFNLLDNAEKYSPEAPEIELKVEKEGLNWRLSVRDQGIGMSREAQKKVFQKFYRVPTGNIHNVKGFGLGLSYVKGMTEAHDGKVEVISEKGKGSTFIILLPAFPPSST